MSKLKRSNDRKVANAVSPNGKTPTIANTFGLPAGKAFSCPGATSICESVCYAGKLEKVYKGVKAVLLHNWELLRNADRMEMFSLLSDMLQLFKDAKDFYELSANGELTAENLCLLLSHSYDQYFKRVARIAIEPGEGKYKQISEMRVS